MCGKPHLTPCQALSKESGFGCTEPPTTKHITWDRKQDHRSSHRESHPSPWPICGSGVRLESRGPSSETWDLSGAILSERKHPPYMWEHHIYQVHVRASVRRDNAMENSARPIHSVGGVPEGTIHSQSLDDGLDPLLPAPTGDDCSGLSSDSADIRRRRS